MDGEVNHSTCDQGYPCPCMDDVPGSTAEKKEGINYSAPAGEKEEIYTADSSDQETESNNCIKE